MGEEFQRCRCRWISEFVPGKMRAVEIAPEEERPAGGPLVEELRDLAGYAFSPAHLHVVEAVMKSMQTVPSKDAVHGLSAPAGPIEVEAAPAYAARIAALSPQQLRRGTFLTGQRRGRPRHARADRRATGHQGDTGVTHCGGEETMKLHPFGCLPVEDRRLDIQIAVAVKERTAVIVAEEQQDLGRRDGVGLRGSENPPRTTNRVAMRFTAVVSFGCPSPACCASIRGCRDRASPSA